MNSINHFHLFGNTLDQYVSKYFLNTLSFVHSHITTKSKVSKMMAPDPEGDLLKTDRLYQLSLLINNTYFNDTQSESAKVLEQSKVYKYFNSTNLSAFHEQNYHFNGFPHDTFAVQFILRHRFICFAL